MALNEFDVSVGSSETPLPTLTKNKLMLSLRQAFINHSEIVRDYIVAIIQVDSGIYNINQLKTILEEPDTTVRMETKWLQSLIKALQIIQNYIRLVESWANHARGLAKNLNFSQDELINYEKLELRASEVLQSKTFDHTYLRWVLQDAAQELERLISTSHQLLTDASRLIELAENFKGPFFEATQNIAQNWQENSRRELLVPLSTILQEIDTSADTSSTLQQFGKYLDIISQVVSSNPVFVLSTSEISIYSPQLLQSIESLITQLLEGTEHLNQFIQIRSHGYSVLIQEQTTLLHAVHSYEVPVGQVFITMGLNPSQAIDTLLPDPLPTDTLPLAFRQAEEALTTWKKIMDAAIPYLNKALVLNRVLQSPAVAKFLQAEQKRLELYREWRPRIMKTFKALCSVLKT